MVFLIDMDGVTSDYVGGVERALKSLGIMVIPRDKMTDYHFGDYPKNIRLEILKLFSSPGFFESLEPIDGAIDSIREIVRRGHQVRICSQPFEGNSVCISEKSEWLRRYLGEDFVKSAYFVSDKTFCKGRILLDDKPEVVGNAPPSWKHIVYAQPYNSHVPEERRFRWSDGIDRLLAMAA